MAGTLRAEATLAAANLVYSCCWLPAQWSSRCPRTRVAAGALVSALPSGALAEGLREVCSVVGSSCASWWSRVWRPGGGGSRSSAGALTDQGPSVGSDGPSRGAGTPPAPTSTLKRLTVATLIANIVIVVTGGAVRLTGSGLGCPTWPRCSGSSFVVHGALGVHGFIEFSDRHAHLRARGALSDRDLGGGAASCGRGGRPSGGSPRRVSNRRSRHRRRFGGLAVLSDLNPWVVDTPPVAVRWRSSPSRSPCVRKGRRGGPPPAAHRPSSGRLLNESHDATTGPSCTSGRS